MDSSALIRMFNRWGTLRAAFHAGWWTVTALYLVVDANLSAFELIILGTAQGVTTVLFEVPTGVMADTISRKWSLVIAHALMCAGMVLTGITTSPLLLVLAMSLWGLGWAFTSGAEVAWITDELNQPANIAAVLARSARLRVVSSVLGTLALGGIAWGISMAFAIVLAGVCMGLLGFYVVFRFPEQNFVPATGSRWRASRGILVRGYRLARADRTVMTIFAAVFLLNGAEEVFGRLYAKQLVDLGFPQEPDPIAWYTALALATMVLAGFGFRLIEARINGVDSARRMYVLACLVGVAGCALLAIAPNASMAVAAVMLFNGWSSPVSRQVSVIWVNWRTTSEVRATVHSFLSQAENAGEIVCGLSLGIAASMAGIMPALFGAAACVALAALLVDRDRNADSAATSPTFLGTPAD